MNGTPEVFRNQELGQRSTAYKAFKAQKSQFLSKLASVQLEAISYLLDWAAIEYASFTPTFEYLLLPKIYSHLKIQELANLKHSLHFGSILLDFGHVVDMLDTEEVYYTTESPHPLVLFLHTIDTSLYVHKVHMRCQPSVQSI